jgi:hypothetical protein
MRNTFWTKKENARTNYLVNLVREMYNMGTEKIDWVFVRVSGAFARLRLGD